MIVWDIVMLASLPFLRPVFPEKQKKRLILCSAAAAMIMQTKSKLKLPFVNANLFLLLDLSNKKSSSVMLFGTMAVVKHSRQVLLSSTFWLISFLTPKRTWFQDNPFRNLNYASLPSRFRWWTLMPVSCNNQLFTSFQSLSYLRFLSDAYCVLLYWFFGDFFMCFGGISKGFLGAPQRVWRWKMSNASLNSLLRLLLKFMKHFRVVYLFSFFWESFVVDVTGK